MGFLRDVTEIFAFMAGAAIVTLLVTHPQGTTSLIDSVFKGFQGNLSIITGISNPFNTL